MRTLARWGACLALALAAAAPAKATTLIRQDVPGLVKGSSDIAVGRVTKVASRWDESHSHIVTDVIIQVSESFKGERRTLTLTQLGGEVDGMRLTVPATPLFKPGEEALFFVWRDPAGHAQLNGLGQGKFEIRTDPVSHERLLSRGVPGLAIGEPKTLRPPQRGQMPARLTLEAMRREILKALAGR